LTIQGLYHLVLTVADMDATCAFWFPFYSPDTSAFTPLAIGCPVVACDEDKQPVSLEYIGWQQGN